MCTIKPCYSVVEFALNKSKTSSDRYRFVWSHFITKQEFNGFVTCGGEYFSVFIPQHWRETWKGRRALLVCTLLLISKLLQPIQPLCKHSLRYYYILGAYEKVELNYSFRRNQQPNIFILNALIPLGTKDQTILVFAFGIPQ